MDRVAWRVPLVTPTRELVYRRRELLITSGLLGATVARPCQYGTGFGPTLIAEHVGSVGSSVGQTSGFNQWLLGKPTSGKGAGAKLDQGN